MQIKNKKLFRTGVTGTIIAAICCFTPVLVVVFNAIGLAALIGLLDYILLPALLLFVGITVYALVKK